ncbi:MAG: DUF362 domain-containing protein [Methanoregula sp.]|jgi:uncharacterized protein (DUF362 family)|uniref:DUF362 domain-containing protein n=1 Tax=Methanoregula sp. TaxID=2052170 RepID=UPI003D0C0142
MTGTAEIFIAGAADRPEGIRRVLGEFDLSVLSGAAVALKANFNSADPYPASTHIGTLGTICDAIIAERPGQLTLAERSGMGRTSEVLTRMGVASLAHEKGFSVSVLDDLDRHGWQEVQAPGLHWSRGFFLASVFAKADRVVQTCCLKTHRYGGHFTLSLKNSVGGVARRVPGVNYDFMGELHSSPHQRSMIAEINRFYRTDLVVMDATEGFASGGPDKGKLIKPGLIIAGSDRVALDAVGVALLRVHGTVPDVADGRIFGLEQIARAAELGVGVASAGAIRLVPLDSEGETAAQKIQEQLDAEKQEDDQRT